MRGVGEGGAACEWVPLMLMTHVELHKLTEIRSLRY